MGALSYLRKLPVGCVKLDGDLVAELGTSPVAGTVLRSVLDLARGLGIRTIAESVESDLQLAELVRLGCDRAHGRHLGSPVPAESVPTLVGELDRSNRSAWAPGVPLVSSTTSGNGTN